MTQRESTEASRVAAIVLHWGKLDSTRAAIASLTEQRVPRMQILIVDQVGDYPEVNDDRTSVLRPSANLGFAGGVNLALKQLMAAAVDYVLLFNNDAIAAPDLICRLAQALDAASDAAAAGPTVLRSGSGDRIWYGGGKYSRRRAAVRHLAVGAEYAADLQRRGSDARPVTFISGCALMLRMAAVRELGPMDDRFFVYWEDADWCARALECRWSLLYVPLGVAHHDVSQSFGESSPTYIYYVFRNRLLFIALHTPRIWRPLAYGSMTMLAVRELALTAKRNPRRCCTVLGMLCRAYRHGATGRYGQLEQPCG